MKTLFRTILVVAMGLLAIPVFAAPTAPTFSPLSSAQSATSTSIVLASTSGMSASTTTGVPNTYFILVDTEIEKITAIPTSGTLTVQRGQDGTTITPHASGVYAVFGFFATGNQWSPTVSGSPTYGVFLDKGTYPTGACTRTSMQYAPFYVIGSPGINGATGRNAKAGDCIGGKFQYGDWPATVAIAAARQCTIPLSPSASDLTAYGTDATRVSGTIYVASFDVPGPLARVVTTLSNLTGTTAPTTDKQIFAIYDSAPGTTTATPIAWTALGGVAAATADIFFDQSLTTPAVLVPARYFLALQLNGGTTTIQMIATAGGYNAVVGNSRTGVFGTLGAITVPTTLTTSAAPIMCSNL